MKIFVFLLLFCFSLFASDTNETKENEPVKLNDSKKIDEQKLIEKTTKSTTFKQKDLRKNLKKIINSLDDETKLYLEQKLWKKISPPTNGFDWVQDKHGDWIKGYLKGVFNYEVEIDTKGFGIQTFKLQEIKQLKTNGVFEVNIENVAIVSGLVRIVGDKVFIVTDEHTYEFEKDQIISISKTGDHEYNYWSGDIALNIDIRRGNKNQFDGSLNVDLRRTTAKSRFLFDYLGRFTQVEDVKTADDNQFNAKFDKFLNRKFFITPIFASYLNNEFTNIRHQITLGAGIGYSIYKEIDIEWDITAGPAALYTQPYTVETNQGKATKSFAFEFRTKYMFRFNRNLKFKADYHATVSKKDSGRYQHRLMMVSENDIIKDKIFIDISFIWDYLDNPKTDEKGNTPKKSDTQILVGGGIKF